MWGRAVTVCVCGGEGGWTALRWCRCSQDPIVLQNWEEQRGGRHAKPNQPIPLGVSLTQMELCVNGDLTRLRLLHRHTVLFRPLISTNRCHVIAPSHTHMWRSGAILAGRRWTRISWENQIWKLIGIISSLSDGSNPATSAMSSIDRWNGAVSVPIDGRLPCRR
jgi:hypothetical protein